jgi:hypothetical protein
MLATEVWSFEVNLARTIALSEASRSGGLRRWIEVDYRLRMP